ncbi:SDR family NAD(P)-dependent oxidoreductase [Kibdelosporangium aridum]|uniref:NAD(P)-dependent dehydrogenase, short-chain alcohol dehydrogenase family n=1 Tax=Kibdelosporangium aridum TaxID=2030 RepID=A0A1W2A0B6_KIBAR|nr:SDR family oxidoreductase [Kibdelosporangium aridum]SMC53758.1 NAD(P)-dependent dehydrogenase, short-chain alcohol dehydrogenase family [Kibdelosporangium aridum]
MSDFSDFAGLVAIVTGGASGIGLATAKLLSGRGAKVAALDLKPDGLPEDIAGFETNVTDDAQVKSAVDAVVERFGRLDIVVNNAGIGAIGDVAANGDDEWLRVLDVNVVGMARVARHALPHLRKSPAAAIVNTCSIAAWAGLPQRALYSASKGAVYALTLAMAADHVREGIRVNCVAPGTADTPWVSRLLDQAEDPAAERAALNARQPTGRLVSADEVANAIAYLASPLSGATVGTVLAVDGGMHGLRLRPPAQQ